MPWNNKRAMKTFKLRVPILYPCRSASRLIFYLYFMAFKVIGKRNAGSVLGENALTFVCFTLKHRATRDFIMKYKLIFPHVVFLCDTGVQAVHQADLLSDHSAADPSRPQPQDLPRHAQEQAQVRPPPPFD